MMRILFVALSVLLSIVHLDSAQAGPITFKFKGSVESFFIDPLDPFGGTLGIGTPFIGAFTFDSAAPDAIQSPAVGSYSMFGTPFEMEVFFGTNAFNVVANEFLNIGVANNIGEGIDQYTVLAQQGIPGGLNDYLSMQLFFEDSTGSVFGSDDLVLTPPDLSLFTMASFFLDGVQTFNDTVFQFQVQGQIDVLTVPEPGTALLIVTGMAAIVFNRRRQRFESLSIAWRTHGAQQKRQPKY